MLAAGNAFGDIAMLAAAPICLGRPARRRCREYVYDDEKILHAAAQNRWNVISMRDDFTTLWPTHLSDGEPRPTSVDPFAVLRFADADP